MAHSADPAERRERLVEVFHEARECVKCPLASTRTQVVFGSGNADAELMFIGEAPGAREDEQGIPFVGRAGELLNSLIGEIGLRREDVFIGNVIKCLRYNALVQLGDGSWERIGRLVRNEYSGDVMSVGPDGSIEPRRVTGWHATPLGDRRVFKLSYASAKRAGRHRIGIELTEDHPVLTRRGFVEVRDLAETDEVAVGQGLSPTEFDVVCGTLLGDGHIGRKSSALSFGHSSRQRDYAVWKARVLERLSPKTADLQVAAVSGGPTTYPVIHVRTRADRALRILRRDFYRPTKVVPRWISELLTARMLAVLFMDDGHLRIRSDGRRPSAEIATVGFSRHGVDRLVLGIRGLGVDAKVNSGRVHFGVDATVHLSELIAPFVPPPMRHKIHPVVERRVLFDEQMYEPEGPKTLYDRVVLEDRSDRIRHDVTYFCLDVEETQNFVTAGGVVHNCRPPGNRDPLPAEIEACRPYLERQIELIQPRVIGTLGNFATKLITQSPAGITRVRGNPQSHQLAGREVTVVPLFHPAAALRTPKLVEDLRADMAVIAGLLDGPAAAEPAPPPQPATGQAAIASQPGLFGSGQS